MLYYIFDFHVAIVPRNWTLDSIYNSCKILQVITDYYKQSKWDKYVFQEKMEAEAHFTGHLTIFYTFHIGLCYILKTTSLMSHCATTLKYNIVLCILYDAAQSRCSPMANWFRPFKNKNWMQQMLKIHTKKEGCQKCTFSQGCGNFFATMTHNVETLCRLQY